MASSFPQSHFKAILFDWGGVFTLARRSTNSTSQVEKSLQLPLGTLSKQLYDNEYWTKAQLGQITDEEFWRLTLRQFNIFDERGIAKFKAALFKGEKARLRTGMVKLVKQLRRNYSVALVTNADDLFRRLLKSKFHADHLFDHVIISADIGFAKPNPKIFRKACRVVGVKENKCIFIDDSVKNVESAKTVGIRSIQYITTALLKKELRLLGLDV